MNVLPGNPIWGLPGLSVFVAVFVAVVVVVVVGDKKRESGVVTAHSQF